jgi:hypothetical protein
MADFPGSYEIRLGTNIYSQLSRVKGADRPNIAIVLACNMTEIISYVAQQRNNVAQRPV